jgi:hypothetical protein
MTPEERMRLLRNSDEWTFTLTRRPSPFPARKQFSPWVVSFATIAAVAVIGIVVFSVFGLGIRSARPIAPPVAPTQSASPTPSPAPTATGSTATEPASRFAFTCADLATDAQVSTMMGSTVHAVDALEDPLTAFWGIPREGSIEQVGGLVCTWSNGVPYNSIAGSSTAGTSYVGLQVELMPDSAAGFRKAGVTGNSFVGCSSTNCNASSLLGSTWLQSAAQRTTLGDRTKQQRTADFQTLEANIDKVVTDAGSPTARAASTADALPSSCTDYVSDATLSTAVGVDMVESTSGDGGGGGWSLEAEAQEQAQFAYACQWGMKGNDGDNLIVLSVLPAGAWIPTKYSGVDAPQGAASALSIPGLPASDKAWIRCDLQGDAPDDYCVVDLAIGGNWVELTLFPKQGGWDNPKRPLPDVLTEVATAVAESLK